MREARIASSLPSTSSGWALSTRTVSRTKPSSGSAATPTSARSGQPAADDPADGGAGAVDDRLGLLRARYVERDPQGVLFGTGERSD